AGTSGRTNTAPCVRLALWNLVRLLPRALCSCAAEQTSNRRQHPGRSTSQSTKPLSRFERSLAGFLVIEIQTCVGQGSLFFDIDLFEAGLYEFTSGSNDRRQITFTGAVAGHGQPYLFLGQRHQTFLTAAHGSIQAFVFAQILLQLLGMLTHHGVTPTLLLIHFSVFAGAYWPLSATA